MTFGNLLREFRENRNMTLRDLGTKASMDYIMLNKVELGLRIPPPLEGIMALSDALGLSEKDFERLLDLAAHNNGESGARFTSNDLQRIKDSKTAQTFFTRRQRERE